MQHRRTLLIHDRIEIAEHDWLICGLLWLVIGTLALGSLGPVSRAGRILFAFTLSLHMIEALYTATRAGRPGLSAPTWFLKTIVLGSLALLALETHIRRAPRLRSVK
jgi:hypothetical protein